MAKRLNGEGSLRRRADGRWEYRLMDGYLEDGRPNTVSFYGRTQKEVRDKLENYRIRHIYGIDTRVKHTFATWSEIWFQNHQDNISPTTRENYKYILTTPKAHLGTRKLDGIKAFDIEQLLKELRREGRSDSYLASCRGMLYQIFNKAEANDLILKNPVRFADKMRSTRTAPKRKDAFHAEEVRRMMEQLPHDLLGESIRLMLGTGIRTQELLALEPRHIAQDGSMISIRQAVNLVKGTVSVGPPKSRDSYRDIPVPPSLRPCAMAIRNTEKKYIWEVGVKDQPCNPSHFRKKFLQPLPLPEKIPGGAETNWGRAASDATLLSAHLRFPDEMLMYGTVDDRLLQVVPGELRNSKSRRKEKFICPADEVNDRLIKLVKKYESLREIERREILDFHYQFECIFPFEDGNGRTGRLLINFELLKNNISPIVIPKEERAKYFELLRSKDITALSSPTIEVSQ